MDKIISEMIEEYGDNKDFYGEVSEEDISRVEALLEFKFPKSYREFVKKFGSGGICGVEIAGVEGSQGASVLKATERYRAFGLEKYWVVINDGGEYFMCMSTDNEEENVFCGDRSGQKPLIHYKSFDEYLIDVFQEGIDNL
ncbi:SMI1/KNR4 family protein [Paenibacillus sp. SYP-B3998]|uniref:SMI1/KNR4 family protein n=1 Tax=Paenibacillus sp. SYP-B3998 TaxID=2678564 RepID=A0A6G4A762_9BACL|nr:SMI1/KNR4 family protein [Paenibacillus sp. SYP-B3998]NEW09784.1 SMI1/KNR4 family protein [Paenibacillus sp. SYP-B3998]